LQAALWSGKEVTAVRKDPEYWINSNGTIDHRKAGMNIIELQLL
jgi:hypothetical protein